MKKLVYAITMLLTVLASQGCGSGSGSMKDASDRSHTATDSMTALDTVATDTIAISLDEMDIEFAKKAAVGGMAEVQFGKLAQQKGLSAEVKQFADRMVKDHGMANEQLSAIAQSKNITLPTTLDVEHIKKLTELQSKSGASFDKIYVMAMVDGHQKTWAMLQDAAQNCKDSALRDFAIKTAPIVKSHLDMVTNMQAKMK